MEAILAGAVFLASHVLVARTRIKPALVARIGGGGYLAVYSLLSIACLGWLIAALVRADRVLLWSTPGWAYAFALAFTAVAFALLGAAAFSPNPLSVAFRTDGFDPTRPGIIGWVRHPILWGFGLWGLAHVPANGEWPTLTLFLGTIAFAALGAAELDARHRRRLGAAAWREQVTGRGALDRNAIVGGLIGLVAWPGMLALHPLLFGVDPWAAAGLMR